ncbi:hypothetical protein WJX81_008235 [Elliptochloris bilobata]|uniref:Transmembrane protein n=1 Tax=Elliptochloris bilobata TaxID=381761 RepID=A0AAW1RIL9_9CHLO
MEERVQAFTTSLSNKVYVKLLAQWRNLQDAKLGTFKHWLYRLAQGVLSREAPEESFLKGVPSEPDSLELIYPSSFEARLVRRRLRLLLRHQRGRFRRRLWGYSLACIPLLPLLATPVPNLPLYYCGYKAFSASSALAGCTALRNMLSHAETQQLQALRAQLQALQASGVVFPKDSWPARLLRPEPRYREVLENIEARVQRAYRGREPSALIPRLTPCAALDELVSPKARLTEPLSDRETLAVAERFGTHGLLEHVARARKRALGSHFPRTELG